MGDPKFSRRKYSTPNHPWKAERIAKELEILNTYGLKNKKEVWKMQYFLKNLKRQSRTLQFLLKTGSQQAKIESINLLNKCSKLGLISENGSLNDILSLTDSCIFDRRLQTIVHKKNLAITAKHSRQIITHRHITINNKIITIPSYLVNKEEEQLINYSQSSIFKTPESPLINITPSNKWKKFSEKNQLRKKKFYNKEKLSSPSKIDIKEEEN